MAFQKIYHENGPTDEGQYNLEILEDIAEALGRTSMLTDDTNRYWIVDKNGHVSICYKLVPTTMRNDRGNTIIISRRLAVTFVGHGQIHLEKQAYRNHDWVVETDTWYEWAGGSTQMMLLHTIQSYME